MASFMPKENSFHLLPLSESWQGDAVITQGENCNSREICLLFGLVAVNANELADSAEKELPLFFPHVRVICTTGKIENESPAAKRPFSGPNRG